MPPDQVRDLLAAATRRLAGAGCATPALDARLLLQAATGLSREDMIVAPEHQVAESQRVRFAALIARREGREPVARILGEREFYGRAFRVTADTLDPRPDTETLIVAALALMPAGARLLDLGTGTGAIAITLLEERPDATGLASDVSAAALAVARDNARRHGVEDRLDLVQGDWFSPVTGRYDIILSNPPYIPRTEIGGLSPDVRDFDPPGALDGGADGLEAYRALAATAGTHLAPRGHVLVEIGAGQGPDVSAIFAGAGFRPAGRHSDLGGHLRCLVFGMDEK
jgi:release factor glutamine methyltransferase